MTLRKRKNSKPEWTCVQCGKTFCRSAPSASKQANGEKNLYCGQTCYFAAVRAGKQKFKGGTRDDRSWQGLTLWMHDWDRQHPRHFPAKPTKPCETCGKSYVPVNDASQTCSRECRKAWRGTCECTFCGCLVNDAKLSRVVRCVACKAKAKRIQRRREKKEVGTYRKRCRKYGGHYNPEVRRKAVFERDGWRCHACGRRTHRTYDSFNPLSATLDHHPVPLSKGGDHDWDNVRCCCKRCNETKSDSWDGQRRLSFVAVKEG